MVALVPPVLRASVVVFTDNGLFMRADLNPCQEGEGSRKIAIEAKRKKNASSRNKRVVNTAMRDTRSEPVTRKIRIIIN